MNFYQGSFYSCLVRMTGLEPAQPCDHKILNLARLPIPPHPHATEFILLYIPLIVKDFSDDIFFCCLSRGFFNIFFGRFPRYLCRRLCRRRLRRRFRRRELRPLPFYPSRWCLMSYGILQSGYTGIP